MRKIPIIVHLINIIGSIAFWLTIYICSVDRLIVDSIIILFLVGIYSIFYFRKNETFLTICLGSVLAFVMYIVSTENIYLLEKFYGIKNIGKLELHPRLQEYIDAKITTSDRGSFFKQTGEDLLFYNRVTGSLYKDIYDNDSKHYGIYNTITDETGYVNLNRGYYNSVGQIDIFISGDSVIQGTGMSSLIEEIKQRACFTIWNLSTGSYSPRQKVNALITYALPKKPQLLIVEFYSGNDVSEANEDEICENSNTYICRFTFNWMREQFNKSPKYKNIFTSHSEETFIEIAIKNIRMNSFCLAVTRRFISLIKKKLREIRHKAFTEGTTPSFSDPETRIEKIDILTKIATQGNYKGITDKIEISSPYIYPPASAHFEIKQDKYDEWIKYGIENTLNSYRRLLKKVKSLPDPPGIVILYNPSVYEIYRDICIKNSLEYDKRAKMQLEALTQFALENKILLVNLLPGLREKVKVNKIWMYGKKDLCHWSPVGTHIAAEVLLEELNNIFIKKNTKLKCPN